MGHIAGLSVAALLYGHPRGPVTGQYRRPRATRPLQDGSHAVWVPSALTYSQSAISFALLYLIEFAIAESIRTAFFEKYQAIYSMLFYLGDLWRRDKIRSWRIPFSGRMRHWDRYDYVYDPNTGEEYRTDTYASKGNILNTLVQGSAADVFKMALQAFWRWVVLHEDFKDAVFPIMQVHDEVVVEVRDDLAVQVAKLLKYCMEYAWFDTPCPILADVHIVNRWSEGKNGKREVLDEAGKPKLDEKGKPVMEDVLPEMNKGLKYYPLTTRPPMIMHFPPWCGIATMGTPTSLGVTLRTFTVIRSCSRKNRYVGMPSGSAKRSAIGQLRLVKRTRAFSRKHTRIFSLSGPVTRSNSHLSSLSGKSRLWHERSC